MLIGRLLLFGAVVAAKCPIGDFQMPDVFTYQSCGPTPYQNHVDVIYRYFLSESCEFVLWNHQSDPGCMEQQAKASPIFQSTTKECHPDRVNVILGNLDRLKVYVMVKKGAEYMIFIIPIKEHFKERAHQHHLVSSSPHVILPFTHKIEDCYEIEKGNHTDILRCYYHDDHILYRMDVVIDNTKTHASILNVKKLSDTRSSTHSLFVQPIDRNRSVIYFYNSKLKEYIEKYVEGSVITHLTVHAIHQPEEGYHLKKFINVGGGEVITVECTKGERNCSYYLNFMHEQAATSYLCLFHLDRFVMTGFLRPFPYLPSYPPRHLPPMVPWFSYDDNYYFHVILLAFYTLFVAFTILSLDMLTQMETEKMDTIFKNLGTLFFVGERMPKRKEAVDVYKIPAVRELKEYQMECKKKLGMSEEDPFDVNNVEQESVDDVMSFSL